MSLDSPTSLIVASMCAFVTSLLALRALSPLATRIGLLDRPNGRKQHVGLVPMTGGLAIAAGWLVSFLVYQQFTTNNNTGRYILIGSMLMLIIGIINDRRNVPWRTRLIAQIIVALIIIELTGLRIHHVLGFDLTSVRGISLGFTVLAIIGLTNAFNLIDGIDGLTGSITLITIANIFAFSTQIIPLAESAQFFLIAGSIFPYLYLNVLGSPKNKVFLGDSGSYMLGFMISISLINFAQGSLPTLSTSSVLWCAALPILDTIGVMLYRLRKGRSPFQPDRLHLHHVLLEKGMSSQIALAWLIGIATILSIVGLLIELHLPNLSAPLFLVVLLLYATTIRRRLNP